MMNLEKLDVQRLDSNEMLSIDGGGMPENYNEVAAVIFFPFYTIGYLLGRV
ncbi:hypothetical protein J0656_03805 [Muricauda ruestringensis]|uniref:Class IIb bacteriocin, lactobin A/cerein 7B family n=1 Tax=Flagellimonas aurea TaxID=2915619 RepID=A0ABS3G173_9FLAO|nr:hypothetical protein [Allomuricauda aurea]MBO0353130.1 hypothetical protein [Allomuricauda aurea]